MNGKKETENGRMTLPKRSFPEMFTAPHKGNHLLQSAPSWSFFFFFSYFLIPNKIKFKIFFSCHNENSFLEILGNKTERFNLKEKKKKNDPTTELQKKYRNSGFHSRNFDVIDLSKNFEIIVFKLTVKTSRKKSSVKRMMWIGLSLLCKKKEKKLVLLCYIVRRRRKVRVFEITALNFFTKPILKYLSFGCILSCTRSLPF